MSPLLAPIILAIFAGVILFTVGLVQRSWLKILLGSPAILLIIIWLLLASRPPPPETEFDRLFDSENRSAATDIRTLKRTFMDGHFLWFHMARAEFETRIRPQFNWPLWQGRDFLHGQKPPEDWPAWLDGKVTALNKEVDYDNILLLYSEQEQAAYVIIFYEQW